MYEGTTYLPCPPYPYRTYAPWFEDWFLNKYKKIQAHTMMKEDAAYTLYQFAQHAMHFSGDIAECGVYKGGSAKLIVDVLRKSGLKKKIFLFDSFEGMPEYADKQRDGHACGDFADTSITQVQSYLSSPEYVDIRPGYIPKSFAGIEQNKFCLVHIDLDLYQATKDALSFFYSRIVPGGILLFDDYGHELYEHAARKAIEEFFEDKPEKPVVLRTGQAFVIKLPSDKNKKIPQMW